MKSITFTYKANGLWTRKNRNSARSLTWPIISYFKLLKENESKGHDGDIL